MLLHCSIANDHVYVVVCRKVKETKPLNLSCETSAKSAGFFIQTLSSSVCVLSDSARRCHVCSLSKANRLATTFRVGTDKTSTIRLI